MLKDTPGMLHCCCMGRRHNRQCPPRISRRCKKDMNFQIFAEMKRMWEISENRFEQLLVITSIVYIYFLYFQGNKCQNVPVFCKFFKKGFAAIVDVSSTLVIKIKCEFVYVS